MLTIVSEQLKTPTREKHDKLLSIQSKFCLLLVAVAAWWGLAFFSLQEEEGCSGDGS